MATVTQPSSARSPTASGPDHTTAAPPPTECWPMRRAAPSNVMSGPRGVARGPKPQGSSTVISWRTSRGSLVVRSAR
eukprot:15478076-Alexandrium_andersonii.AAC.1